MTREEFINTKEFWLAEIQNNLYKEVEDFIKDTKGMNQTKFAELLGVSKGYVSQVLNGDFDHKLSKFIELSLKIGKAPIVRLDDLQEYIERDSLQSYYSPPSEGKIISINRTYQKYSELDDNFIHDETVTYSIQMEK